MDNSRSNPAADIRKAKMKRSKTRAIGIAGQPVTTKKGDIFNYKMIDNEKVLVSVTSRGRTYSPIDYFKRKLGRT